MCWLDWAAQTQMRLGPTRSSQSQDRDMYWLDWAAQTQIAMRALSQSWRTQRCWLEKAAQIQKEISQSQGREM